MLPPNPGELHMTWLFKSVHAPSPSSCFNHTKQEPLLKHLPKIPVTPSTRQLGISQTRPHRPAPVGNKFLPICHKAKKCHEEDFECVADTPPQMSCLPADWNPSNKLEKHKLFPITLGISWVRNQKLSIASSPEASPLHCSTAPTTHPGKQPPSNTPVGARAGAMSTSWQQALGDAADQGQAGGSHPHSEAGGERPLTRWKMADRAMKSRFHNAPRVLLGTRLVLSSRIMPLGPKPFNQTL